MKDYLKACCSCEEQFAPELETPGRVCVSCNKPLCDECHLTNPKEWGGKGRCCVPGLDDNRTAAPKEWNWYAHNHNRSDRAARGEKWQRKRLTGRG